MEKKKKGRPSKTNRFEEDEELYNNSFDGSGNSSKRRNTSTIMEKKNIQAKKKGRPHKQKRLQEEDFNNSSFDCAGNITNDSSSSSLGLDSASLGGPMLSRPRTRSALALGSTNKKAAVSSQSRTPVRCIDIDVNSSENSSLMLVKQILFESNNSMDKSKDTHSEIESLTPDKAVEAQNGVLDLEKFSFDLLAQTQQPESAFQAASPCSDAIMVNNNSLPEKEPNLVSNISANGTARATKNPTTSPTRNKTPQSHEVMSDTVDPTMDIEGYKMKKEVAPLLKAIFKKYGDIARESTFSMESRPCLLEMVCSIYKRLESSTFLQLTAFELESMLGQIEVLKLVKVDVGWLHRRLERISKARQTYDGASTIGDFKARSVEAVNEKQRAVQGCEEELRAHMAEAVKLQERLQREKDELAAAQTVTDEIDIYDGSLVRGLV